MRAKPGPSHRRRGWLLAAAVTLAVAGWAWHRDAYPDFPDQLPGESSDVSARQALTDHGLYLPRSAQGLRYGASRGDEDYPLAATFVFNCAEQEQFAETNALNQVAQWYDMLDVGAYTLADDLGWKSGPISANWFERMSDDWVVTVVVQPTASSSCTAYLMAAHPIDAHDLSPLG